MANGLVFQMCGGYVAFDFYVFDKDFVKKCTSLEEAIKCINAIYERIAPWRIVDPPNSFTAKLAEALFKR